MIRKRHLVVFAVLVASVAAEATTLSVALDIQGQGLTMSEGGVGLQGIGTGSVNLSVNIGGPVQAALLYWSGRDSACPQSGGTCVVPFQPYKDQQLRFDGVLITGTIIGTETNGSPALNNIGFLADVTSIVQTKGTGLVQIPVADGDVASNLSRLNGAGLLVIYTDPADTTHRRLIVFDGLDFAYGADALPGAPRVTSPITFAHGATAGSRVATLTVFAGDAVANRPDRIDISNNASLVNTLNESDGASFDTDSHAVTIPGGVSSTTVQLFSEPVNQFPDSLLWSVGALAVPLTAPVVAAEGCTPGYWKNHPASWAGSGFSPGQTVGSVFAGAAAFPTLAAQTLLQALQGGGGSGTLGAARILLRAAVAALLNAASSGVDFPFTTAEVIADVNAALASNNRTSMLSLANALDGANNAGCPLN